MKAIFRLPFSKQFLLVENQNFGKNLANIISFDEKKSIRFYAEHFKILAQEEIEKSFFEIEKYPEKTENITFTNHEEYLKKIEKTIDNITQNNLSKLVISRAIKKEITTLNLEKTYLKLCEKYQNTLCYLFITENEIWLGATPEILGKFNKKTHLFETMSLAGTLPVSEMWSDKEIEEQKPVTSYISEILHQFSSEIHQSETYNHISGNIKHLRTDFSAKIYPENLQHIITKLHPTPAVCGIPKEFCKEKISEIENYNREFYAGFITLETENDIYYFVNLRCAKILENQVIAFSGGGITALSSPEKEWQETELKSQAILGNLIFE